MQGTYQTQKGAAVHAAEPDTMRCKRRVRTLCGRVFRRAGRLQQGPREVTCAICVKRLATLQAKKDASLVPRPSPLAPANRHWRGPQRYATTQQLTEGLLADINRQLEPLNLFLELHLPSGRLKLLDYRDHPQAVERIRELLSGT